LSALYHHQAERQLVAPPGGGFFSSAPATHKLFIQSGRDAFEDFVQEKLNEKLLKDELTCVRAAVKGAAPVGLFKFRPDREMTIWVSDSLKRIGRAL
jgi:hypothetical protein